MNADAAKAAFVSWVAQHPTITPHLSDEAVEVGLIRGESNLPGVVSVKRDYRLVVPQQIAARIAADALPRSLRVLLRSESTTEIASWWAERQDLFLAATFPDATNSSGKLAPACFRLQEKDMDLLLAPRAIAK